MKIWYAIRRPIGYVLFCTLAGLALILIHAIPELLTNWVLGL